MASTAAEAIDRSDAAAVPSAAALAVMLGPAITVPPPAPGSAAAGVDGRTGLDAGREGAGAEIAGAGDVGNGRGA